MERKLAATILVGAGVWVQWGPGFGLIVLGTLFASTGIDVDSVRAWSRYPMRVWERSRDLAATMPRQTVAVMLVIAAVVLLPVGSALYAGAWLGLVAVGALCLGVGIALGWE